MWRIGKNPFFMPSSSSSFYWYQSLFKYFHNIYLLCYRTCKHFSKLVEDRRLWRTFDFSTKRMMGRQIKKLLSTLQIADINEFKVRGYVTKYPSEKWKNNTISVNTLRKLSSTCPLLETMEFREGYINFQKVMKKKNETFKSKSQLLIYNIWILCFHFVYAFVYR